MDIFQDPTVMSIAGGAVVFLLTSLFKQTGWSDSGKVIFLAIVAVIIGTGWWLFGIYPTWFVALQQVASYALIIFTILVKLLGLKWRQE